MLIRNPVLIHRWSLLFVFPLRALAFHLMLHLRGLIDQLVNYEGTWHAALTANCCLSASESACTAVPEGSLSDAAGLLW